MILIAAMIVTFMTPMLALAAMEAVFHFDKSKGILYGEVYVRDPSGVQVNVTKRDNTIETITSINPPSPHLYDNQNNQYKSVTYAVYMDQAPAKVTITNGQETALMDQFNPDVDWTSAGYSSVILDIYRMQGNLLLSSQTEGSYIAAGSDLFDFTPSAAGTDVLQFKLPYNMLTHGKHHNIALSDFEIENVTVGQAVYADSLLSDSLFYGKEKEYTIGLQMEDAFIAGNRYKIKLSESAVNKLELPKIVSGVNHFTVNASIGKIEMETYTFPDLTTITFPTLIRENTLYLENISLVAENTDGGGGGGGGGGYIPPVNADKQTVNESSLKNGKDGKVAIDIANGAKQVLLPADAAKTLGSNNLELKAGNFTLEIPASVFADLAALVSAEDLQGASISFSANEVTNLADAIASINNQGSKQATKLKSAGEMIDLQLVLITKDGKEHKLGQFAKPLKLSLKLSADANGKLVGIYFIGDNGVIEFVGGKIENGEVVGYVTHFSRYAVLEFDKQFTDVPVSHWASNVIKNMAAKHVIAGVSDASFAPGRDVTRAQMAAFIVRALGLKASGSTAFTDVASNKWYAAEVAAAAEAGIISGRSAKLFAPEDVISREEMAVMIVRAHEYMTGSTVTASPLSNFVDASKISDWAQSYVNAAHELGYIQGRGNNQFAPAGTTTRAESAQVVSLLIKDRKSVV